MLCAASICGGGAQPLTVNAALYSSEMTSGNFLYKKVDVNYDHTYDYHRDNRMDVKFW